MTQAALLRPQYLFMMVLVCCSLDTLGQDLFEMQVYPYETTPPKATMVELHWNTFPRGTQNTSQGLYANNHQFHLTAEVTRGLTDHWEVGGYLVSAYVPNEGLKLVGTRIRPRYSFPGMHGLPFKLGVAAEVGFNKHQFDPDSITLEIRPILEREVGNWYFSVNPTLGKSLRGPDAHRGFGLEPAIKVAYNLTRMISPGLEYYAETGPIAHFDVLKEQHHLIFPTVDLNTSPKWEINIGVGRGLTGTSEHWVIKWIIGRRL
jgi:hypothetical protein